MAETSYGTSPKLRATADEQPYTPVSWLAASAGVSLIIFLILFVLLAISSFLKKQPLIMPALLFLPVLTAVLAFAAYCHVNNSEGTRTGKLGSLNLINWSGGLALLVGAGYFAYLAATEVAVRKDAENVFLEWTKNLENLKPGDPNDPGIAMAMHRTLEPSAQQRISPTDTVGIRAAFNEAYVQFSQCDIVRISSRHPGKVSVKPQGLVNWERDQQKVRCTLNADVISPEGIHSISLEMYADIAPNGARLWGIQNRPSYVTSRKLTPYGRLVEELEVAAAVLNQRFLEPLSQSFAQRFSDKNDLEVFRRMMYRDFIAHAFPPAQMYLPVPVSLRTVLGGGMAGLDMRDLGYESTLAQTVFTPMFTNPNLSPDDRKRQEAEIRQTLLAIWNGNRIARPGQLFKNSKDVFPVLVHDEKSIRVSCPCEMIKPGSDLPTNATRGRVIFECTDPKILSTLLSLESQANPSSASDAGGMQMPEGTVPWKVIRIETDLRPGPTPQVMQSSMEAPQQVP